MSIFFLFSTLSLLFAVVFCFFFKFYIAKIEEKMKKEGKNGRQKKKKKKMEQNFWDAYQIIYHFEAFFFRFCSLFTSIICWMLHWLLFKDSQEHWGGVKCMGQCWCEIFVLLLLLSFVFLPIVTVWKYIHKISWVMDWTVAGNVIFYLCYIKNICICCNFLTLLNKYVYRSNRNDIFRWFVCVCVCVCVCFCVCIYNE